ncbi:putative RNA recognition motif domain, nucleotide-binding alpha-beta plait domain superfamily [Helianthus anomalus]
MGFGECFGFITSDSIRFRDCFSVVTYGVREKLGGNEVDDERTWTDVQYGKNRKSRGDGVEITFLVQNLPERTTKEILWRSFQPHGFVTDAYVARKKDKKGNFFGFVRFVGVGNFGETIQQMNTVKIFEAKVTVSLAKYDKNHKKFIYTPKVMGEKVWKPKEPVHRSVQGNGVNPPGGAAVREGRSFAREGRFMV